MNFPVLGNPPDFFWVAALYRVFEMIPSSGRLAFPFNVHVSHAVRGAGSFFYRIYFVSSKLLQHKSAPFIPKQLVIKSGLKYCVAYHFD